MPRHFTSDDVGRQRLIILFVFGCSLLVKLAGVAYMNRYLSWNLMAPDTRDQYRVLALNVVEHRGYQFNGDYRAATRIAPGFPLYMAAVYEVAGEQAPTWLFGVLNALMRAAVTCLVYGLAVRAFGAGPALIAAFIHAVDPWEAFWAAFVLKESLAVLLSVVAVCAIVWMLESAGSIRGVCAGLAIAIAGLTRYAMLGLFVAALALLLRHAIVGRLSVKSTVRLAMAMTAGLLIGLSPWLVRNQRVFGSPLMHMQPGHAFFVSNGPGTERVRDTSGYSGWSKIDETRANDIARRHPDVSERDTAFFRSAVVHVLSNPLAAAATVGARLVNMWRPTFAGASTANMVVLGIPYCLLMVAAAFGLRLGWRHSDSIAPAARGTSYWAVGFVVLLHLAFWSEIRYRQYATPFLTIFAGLAVARIWTRLHEATHH